MTKIFEINELSISFVNDNDLFIIAFDQIKGYAISKNELHIRSDHHERAGQCTSLTITIDESKIFEEKFKKWKINKKFNELVLTDPISDLVTLHQKAQRIVEIEEKFFIS